MTFAFSVRRAVAEDVWFLEEMLAVAADWRPGLPTRPVKEIMAEPSFAHYVEGWPKQGDFGVVAEAADPVGATWWRFLGRDDPGFGFVDEKIPELTVGVTPDARGKGVGTAMLKALIDEAARRKLLGLSLSVEPDNYAMRLYEQVGFRAITQSGGAITMLLSTPSDGP